MKLTQPGQIGHLPDGVRAAQAIGTGAKPWESRFVGPCGAWVDPRILKKLKPTDEFQVTCDEQVSTTLGAEVRASSRRLLQTKVAGAFAGRIANDELR